MNKLLTAAALALAIAVGGFTVSSADDHKSGFPKKFEEKISKLPKDKQELVKKSFEEGKAERKANWEKAKTLREEVKTILTAEKFDKDAFLAKSKEIAALKAESQTKGAERFADLASKMNVEERKILAEIMPKGRKGKKAEGEDKPEAE